MEADFYFWFRLRVRFLVPLQPLVLHLLDVDVSSQRRFANAADGERREEVRRQLKRRR